MERNRRGITRIHQALSRNGFDSLLEQTIAGITLDNLQQISNWISRWCAEMTSRAQKASGYPDALNFKAAGIKFTEYSAMCDIERKLSAR